MSVLAIWTLLVLCWMTVVRFRAVRAGRVRVEDFRRVDAARVPDDVGIAGRNYINLFELPVLFYAVCLVTLATDRQASSILVLAWIFVASRIVHSLIHLTYNNVMHRMAMFGVGVVVVAIMWIKQLV
jgi:hypothetical protein